MIAFEFLPLIIAGILISAICYFYHIAKYPNITELSKGFRKAALSAFLMHICSFLTCINLSSSPEKYSTVMFYQDSIYEIFYCAFAYFIFRYAFIGLTDSKKEQSRTLFFVKILFLIKAISLIVNIIFKNQYYYDENTNVIASGPLYVQFVVYLLIFITSFVLLIKNANTKKFDKFFICEIIVSQLPCILNIVLSFFPSYYFVDTYTEFFLSFFVLLSMLSKETPNYNKIQSLMNELTQKEEEAIAANKSKSNFLAKMSHEIRTPMNAILGMSEMIIRESEEKSSQEYADDIKRASKNLLSIVNDILDLSKLESGKMELVEVRFELKQLFIDVKNIIHEKADEKALEMKTEIDEKLPSIIFGDDTRIRQILINVLNNAVKYTEKGWIKLSCKVMSKEPVKDKSFCKIRFSVEDSGIGIKQEDLKKLGDKFQRIEERRNKSVEGTGLGMNIALQFLNLMGSKMQIESEYGKGSKFFFDIDLLSLTSSTIGKFDIENFGNKVLEKHKSKFIAPDAKILVVDDNTMNCKVFKSLLKMTKIQIDEANGGYECLEKVKKTKYNIIFLDHMMPDLDGVQTLHEIRKFPENEKITCPIVALTANTVVGAREMLLDEGFDNFLSKPVIPEKLEEMLWKLLPSEFLQESTDSESQNPIEKNEKSISFPEIEDMDWKRALGFLKSETDVSDTIQTLCKISDSECKKLQDAYAKLLENQNEETFKAYRIQVHSMKSSANMVGAICLYSIAKFLEHSARDENFEIIKSSHENFMNLWKSKIDELKTFFLKEESAENKVFKTAEEVRPLIEKICSAMETLDIDTADPIVEELKTFGYEADLKEKMENLFIAVLNLDKDECKKIAGEI